MNVLSYVTHKEVLQYLHEYKEKFDLDQYISYGSLVTQLTLVDDVSSKLSGKERWPAIKLQWQTGSKESEDTFDAVCIANGHYGEPSVPPLDGLEDFQGTTMHSIEYDDPADFEGQVVLCVGGRASGSDVAREISPHAKHVFLSDSTAEAVDSLGNVTLTPRTIKLDADGHAHFDHGCTLAPHVDTIIFCTGYDYSFPFINEKSKLNLSVIRGERRVMPLYRQLWHAECPNLSFIGLPHSVLPFPLFELQVEAVAQEFREFDLPSVVERSEAAKVEAESGGAKKSGLPRDTHYLGAAQWDYCRELARTAGLYDKRMELYIATNKVSHCVFETCLMIATERSEDYV